MIYLARSFFRNQIMYLNSVYRCFSSQKPPPFVIPCKESKNVDADIVNYGTSGIFFSAYNEDGFVLNNGTKIVGPCAAFPRNAFFWNIKSALDIDEKSLSLFFLLEPRLDILIIGKGETKSPVNYREILNLCWKHKLCAEVMPTCSLANHFKFIVHRGLFSLCTHNLRTSYLRNNDNLTKRAYSKYIEPKEVDTVSRNDQPKRLWPRQGSKEDEAVSPPRSTSVATTSTAPLIKDFFKGQLNLELLEFPELDNLKKVEELNVMHSRFKQFILKLNSTAIDRDGVLSQEVLSSLNNFRLFGLKIDENYGGLGFNHTQWVRACEAFGLDGSVMACLTTHQSLAAKAIQLSGTDDQKYCYLPKLASGEHKAAFALSEFNSGNDIRSITTVATWNETDQQYILNGHKTWITNGTVANIFVVFARTNEEINGNNISAFIVDSSKMNGVRLESRLDTFGLRGSNLNNVTFDNVIIPKENLLGKPGDGIQLANYVINLSRLDIIASGVGILRYLITYITEHCLQRHQFGFPIGDYGLVQQKLSQMVTNLYAMESGIYYLSGLLDSQPSRDLSLELAALKIFSSEKVWSCIDDCIQLTGRFGLTKDVPFERFLRDSRHHLINGGSNDVLRVWIAGEGLSSIAPDIQKNATKLLAFTRHLVTTFKTYYRFKGRKRGWHMFKVGSGPKCTEGGASRALKDHLHPNFADISTELAVNVQRFQNLSEALLITHGPKVVQEQMALGRVTNCVIDLMLIAISLGRASRSISIGLPLKEYEMTVATTFSKQACQRIEKNLVYPFELDNYEHRIASELLTQRIYPIAHALSRSW